MAISPTNAPRAAAAGAGTPSPPPLQGHQGRAEAEGATTAEAVLCGHCGRTATNGIACQGMCVADSGY